MLRPVLAEEKLTADILDHCPAIRDDKNLKGKVVFLFRVTINQGGCLTDVKRMEGEESALSGMIKKSIEATSGYWRPEQQGGRPVKSIVDIFVQITYNRGIEVSYSGLNRR